MAGKRKIPSHSCSTLCQWGAPFLAIMVENVQTDIWVRLQKMLGHDVHLYLRQ